MRVALGVVITTLLCALPLSADSAWYQPTPYDVSIATGIQHIWDGWITSVYYGKVLIRDDKMQIGGYGDEYRSYLKFDTIGLPQTVTRAVLNVMPYPRGDDSTLVGAKISKVTSSWIPTLVWDSQPSSSLITSLPTPTVGQWWAATITNTFNAWQTSTATNYGVVIAPLANANNFDVLRSSRYADDSQRPALLLEFTPPVPTPSFKMPLPGGVSWLVTTEPGGYDCTGVGLQPDTGHTGTNYFSIDFSWNNQDATGKQVYSNPASGGNIPILAASAGKIVATSVSSPIPDNGNYVVVSHDSGGDANVGFSTRYLHMRDIPLVTVGQSVQQGDQLGWMGSSGNSTAPHLHFGVRYNNDGAFTRTEVTYVTVDSWLLKSFQTECSASGAYIRYYHSSNRIFQPPSFTSNGMADPWTYQTGLSPGGWTSIFGQFLASSAEQWQPVSGQLLQTTLGGSTVRINGTPGALSYASDSVVNVLVPGNVPEGNATVIVERDGIASQPMTAPVKKTNPAIYSVPILGTQPIKYYVTALLGGTSQLIGTIRADSRVSGGAHPGDLVDLYTTGLGTTVGGFPTDTMFSGAFPLSNPILVTLGATQIIPDFAGLTSPGLYLVRIRIPSNVSPGDLPIHITSGAISSADNVLLTVESAPGSALALLTPTDGATIPQNDQSTGCPADAVMGYGSQINFTWTNPSGTSSYELYAIHQGANQPIIDQILSTPNYSYKACNAYVADPNLTGWQWRVRAMDNAGNAGPWSGYRMFTFAPCRINGVPCGAPVTSAAVLQSVTVNPTSVTGGQSATGTVTLSASAPAGGVVVQVSIGTQPAVAISVAAGTTSASFQITTPSVTSSTTFTITALLNGVQKTATLTVLPAASTSPFGNYDITIQATLTLNGKQVSTVITSSLSNPILPYAHVDTSAGAVSSGILLIADFYQPSLSGNTVAFAQVYPDSGTLTLISDIADSGPLISGTLSLTTASPTVGTTVTGSIQVTTPSKTFTSTFTGQITTSTRTN